MYVSARATRAGVRSSPSRWGSGSSTRRMLATADSMGSDDMGAALTHGARWGNLSRHGRAVGPALRRRQQSLDAQALEDGPRRRRLVERIEMEPGTAGPQQLGALRRRPFHRDLERSRRIA